MLYYQRKFKLIDLGIIEDEYLSNYKEEVYSILEGKLIGKHSYLFNKFLIYDKDNNIHFEFQVEYNKFNVLWYTKEYDEIVKKDIGIFALLIKEKFKLHFINNVSINYYVISISDLGDINDLPMKLVN